MKETLKMVRDMDKGLTLTLMETNTLGNGKKVSATAKESSLITMAKLKRAFGKRVN